MDRLNRGSQFKKQNQNKDEKLYKSHLTCNVDRMGHGSQFKKEKKEMHNQISSSGQGLEHGSHGSWIAAQKVKPK